MKRASVLIILFAISLWTAAQTTGPTQMQQVRITQPGGLSTNTGTAVIVAPPSTPLLVTPEVHLTTVVPQMGATNATAGNSAGAANATASMPVEPRLQTTVPQFASSGAAVYETAPPAQNASSATSTAAGTPTVNNSQLLDRGVGSGGMLVAGGDTGGRSLGEIARENRQQAAGANAHVYTNDDIQRINQQPQTQIGGMTGAAMGTGNAAQPQPSSNMPVVAQPTANPPANPGVSQPVPPSNTPPRDQSEATPPLGQAPTQANAPSEMAQANRPANPADQDQRASSPGAERNQLPRSGSILPLMTLVGFLAAGAGLLSR